MKKKTKSDKELDLIDLGLAKVYSACYSFGFGGLSLLIGLALSCSFSRYDVLAARLPFLLVGSLLVALSFFLIVLGFYLLDGKGNAKKAVSLRCPIQSKKVIRNGYIIGAFLCLVGLTTLILSVLQFPGKPIHGIALLAGSFVALLYGMLLLISTIRDQLIVKRFSSSN